ncbi:phage tail tape measure protein [Paracidovorax wautersii]|uniref:Phage tail tape measure protein, lambda family n=1 Tax=Paracidovorax wautersii TaxID=1177982 RepID=A0A1I2E7H3_9BURK|nr:phage tail tape measure protein [Paracidovorax wautersii]SFE88795.1 phage tail tape measure protein, lambda family [Paracidovorax wautersii]
MTPIGIVLTLDGDRQVEAGVRRVTGSIDLLGGSVGSLRSALGGLTGAFAGVVSVREFLKAADAVTMLENRLKLVSASVGQAAFAYEALYQIAQRSRVSFTELGGTYASVAAATANLGISQTRLLTVTEAIANAVTISGSSAQASQAALIQLGQGLASGTLRGEELNSVMEQTPRLAQALADGLGVSRGELRKMGEQGAITAEKVIKALESQAAVLNGEVKDATLTVGQAMTQLGNAAVRTVGDLDKASGISAAFASSLSGLAAGINTVGEAARTHEVAVKALVGALGGGAAVAGAVGLGLGVARIGAAVGALGAVLAANPLVLALLGLGVAGGAAVGVASAYNKSAAGIQQAIDTLRAQNERSESALASALAGGRDAGAENIRKVMEGRRASILKLEAELSAMNAGPQGTGGGRGSSNPTTVGSAMQQEAEAARELIGIRQKLYGVDKDYLPTLTKLHAQFQAGKLSLEDYRDLVGRLAKANFKEDKDAKAGEAAAHRLGKANMRSDVSELQQDYRNTAEVLRDGERLLEAERQAHTIADADYYMRKRAYIKALAEAEAESLEAQNRVLKGQKLKPEERVDADRKIAENAEKATRIRAKAATDLALSNMEEAASVRALANAYQDARDAAAQQLRASRDRYDRELQGMGLGSNWRDRNAARNQIDDKYQAERDRLAGDLRRNQITRAQYEEFLSIVNTSNAQALDSDRNYWSRRAELQGSWQVGASEALNSYLDNARNVAGQSEAMWTKAFSGMEDAAVSFAMTGKASVSDLARSFIADFMRMQIRAQALSLTAGGGGGGFLGSTVGAAMAWLTGRTPVGAAGNAGMGDYSAGGLRAAFGFAAGGYTGPGGKYEPAGIVHKDEFVINSENTRRLGVGFLNRLNSGYSAGGLVGGAGGGSGMLAGLKIELINESGQPLQARGAEMARGNDGDVLRIFLAKAVEASVAEMSSQAAGASGPFHQALLQRKQMGMA